MAIEMREAAKAIFIFKNILYSEGFSLLLKL